ncbi:MAG: DMP19 family protein [Planctomycetaceae bacterium]|nr:DMP19 family protein [Planctomycetaceae bacterium]
MRATSGGSLHSVLSSFSELNDELWLILNRVVDWRERYCDSLLEADRLIAACSGARADVQNGGFHQYFANSSGDFWPDLLKLLQLSRDAAGEAHFREVLAHFPNSAPAIDREERELQLEQLDGTAKGEDFFDPFEALDQRYYDRLYPTDETLFAALKAMDDVEFIPNPD